MYQFRRRITTQKNTILNASIQMVFFRSLHGLLFQLANFGLLLTEYLRFYVLKQFTYERFELIQYLFTSFYCHSIVTLTMLL